MLFEFYFEINQIRIKVFFVEGFVSKCYNLAFEKDAKS